MISRRVTITSYIIFIKIGPIAIQRPLIRHESSAPLIFERKRCSNLIEQGMEPTNNRKLLPCGLSHLSGRKLKFHISKLFCIGAAKHLEAIVSRIFRNQ
jgi:hypothetical protein